MISGEHASDGLKLMGTDARRLSNERRWLDALPLSSAYSLSCPDYSFLSRFSHEKAPFKINLGLQE